MKTLEAIRVVHVSFSPQQLLYIGVLLGDARMVDEKLVFSVGRYVQCKDSVGEELELILGDIAFPARSLVDLDKPLQCHPKHWNFFGLGELMFAVGDEEVEGLFRRPQMEHYVFNEALPKIGKLLGR